MCSCQRTTYRFRCRHKKRKIERCLKYQLRKEGSCWSFCLTRCRPEVRQLDLQKICPACETYFHDKYGKHHYKKFIQYFLEYKEGNGWANVVIEPQTVPRDALLKRQSAPARMGTQPFQIHQPMVLPSELPGLDNLESERGTRKVSGINPKAPGQSYTPSADIPLPADPGLFVVGELEDEDLSDCDDSNNYNGNASRKGKDIGRASRIFTPSPLPKYNTASLPSGLSIVPELAHLAQGRSNSIPCSFTEIEHPAPKVYGTEHHTGYEDVDGESDSDVDLVKKLTKAASDMRIPNIEYFDYDGKYVPRVISPPRGRRRTRTPTPSPSPQSDSSINNIAPESTTNPEPHGCDGTSEIDIAIAPSAVPESLVLARAAEEAGREDQGIAKSPSTYFVVAQRDDSSSTGASIRVQRSPSHESIVVPPPRRLDGVLIPPASACPHHARGADEDTSECALCRGAFFKERGLPTYRFVKEESRSVSLSPVLVSVHQPPRRYSCAAQSCYCHGDMEERCPSCQERDKMADQLNMTWI